MQRFSYEKISRCTEGIHKLLGLLYITATMRWTHELFDEYMCPDMMARVINKLAWPYTGIALYDEMGHVCVCLEGFV